MVSGNRLKKSLKGVSLGLQGCGLGPNVHDNRRLHSQPVVPGWRVRGLLRVLA